MRKKLWVISCVILLLAGCSDKPQVSTYHVKDNKEEVAKLEKAISDNQKISEGSGVFFDHQVVVSLQVKPMSKFQKRKITKSFEKEVKSLFPKHDVFVSSDLKITWELDKIIEKKPKNEKLKKELDKIQALAKEET